MPRAALALAAFLAAPCLFAAGEALDAVDLSLADAEALALARNHDVRIERESLAIASAGLDGASGPYDPTLRVDTRYRDRTDPLNTVFSGAPPGEVGPEFEGTFGEAEISKLLPTGGALSVSASVARDRTDSLLVSLTPAYATAVGVDFRQPLLRNRRVDGTRTAIRVARSEEKRSRESLEARVSETLAAVDRAYWDLVAAQRDLTVREANVELALRQQSETEARIETGDLAESDVAEPLAEVERRRVELLVAQEAALRGENALKALILADSSDPRWEARLVPGDSPEIVSRSVSLEAALAEARETRAEIAAARAALARGETEGARAKDAVRPELDLVAAYARRGLAGDENPDALSIPGFGVGVPDSLAGGAGRSLGTIGENRFPDASIGLAFSIPVGNHAARADVAAAEARRRRSALLLSREIQRVEVEVRNAVVALGTAEQRIAAARAGREAAETQLRVADERFAVGTTTSFFVLTRQNDLAQARVSEIAALTDYRKALTEYDRARGRLLAERGIAIEEGVEP